MTASSLAMVLPASDEGARLAPALDELLGCVRRHGEEGRHGAPGAARRPDDVRARQHGAMSTRGCT